MTERQADDPGRRSILEAIRRNLAESAPYDAERREHRHPPPASRAEPVESPASPVERFTYALEGVGGRVTVAPDEARAAEAVREILETAGVRRVVISDSPLVERVVGRVALDGLQLERDPGRAVLFDCEMGITGAQWAIAETGTLALDSDRERHRLASLVPPRHVAIVEASAVRETLAEVLREATARGGDALCRTLTFVTGPSRTSDIELTLAIGVHGPGELHVVIVGGERHD